MEKAYGTFLMWATTLRIKLESLILTRIEISTRIDILVFDFILGATSGVQSNEINLFDNMVPVICC